jgi:hypothetical protein
MAVDQIDQWLKEIQLSRAELRARAILTSAASFADLRKMVRYK